MPLPLTRRGFLQGSVGLGLATPVATIESPCGWKQGAEMPIARSETPAVVLDRWIYVVGGFGASTEAHRYDPAADAWERIADYPSPVNHPGMAVVGGRVIVGGGYSGDGRSAYNEIHALDTVNDGWERIGELPMPMGAFGFGVVDDELYLVGGAANHLGGPAQDMLARWISETGAWELLAPLPDPREHLAVVGRDGAVFAIGGRAHGRDDVDLGAEASRYDPAADRWEQLPPLRAARSGLGGASAGNGVVVIGGETSAHLFDNVDFLHLDTMEWQALDPLPVGRHGIAVAATEGRIYAIGGSIEVGRVANVTSVDGLPLTCMVSSD